MAKHLSRGLWEDVDEEEYSYPVDQRDGSAAARVRRIASLLVDTLCLIPREEGALQLATWLSLSFSNDMFASFQCIITGVRCYSTCNH